jgi:hypothetical protein
MNRRVLFLNVQPCDCRIGSNKLQSGLLVSLGGTYESTPAILCAHQMRRCCGFYYLLKQKNAVPER